MEGRAKLLGHSMHQQPDGHVSYGVSVVIAYAWIAVGPEAMPRRST